MPILQPTAKDVHVNKMLTEISIAYRNPSYIADAIFPIVKVDKQSDIVPKYDQSFWFRDTAGVIGESGTAPEGGYEVDTTATYYCMRYGMRHFISDDQRINQDSPFDADRDVTEFLTDKLLMRRERAFCADFFTSSWTTTCTGGSTVTKWSDGGGSDPIIDIRTYIRTIRRYCGRDANVLVLGDLTYDKLCDHPDFLDRIKYTERGMVTADLMASLLGLDKVLVGKSVYTADEEGLAEASVTYTANWDDDALLLYVPSRPTVLEPAAGYTFIWQASGMGPQWIRKYRDDERLGDWIEVRSYFDQYQVNANLGVWFTDIVD